jgi:hypothetical protein
MLPHFRVRPRFERIAVYTANFGAYDRLGPQPELEGVDWFWFTDDAALRSDSWTIRVARPRYAHPASGGEVVQAQPSSRPCRLQAHDLDRREHSGSRKHVRG